MKWQRRQQDAGLLVSLPVRGAWIEILPVRSHRRRLALSLPVRGAWIEMPKMVVSNVVRFVAPRAGSVD